MDDDDSDGGGGSDGPPLNNMDTGPPSPLPPEEQLVGLEVEVLGSALQFSPNENGGLDVPPFNFNAVPLPPNDTNIAPLPGPPTDPNKKQPPRQKVYQDTSVGPWVVYFRPKPNGKPVRLRNISRDLENGFPSVSLIHRVNQDKVRVVVGNLKEANAIVRCEKFTLEYRVYILAKDVECDGKIFEQGLSAPDLLANGVGRFKDPGLPPVPILDVYQLPGATTKGENRIYSSTWRVTFAGTALPNYVVLGKLRLPVKQFVPRVMNCEKCMQLGHTAAYCSNKARCDKCGQRHEGAPCAIQAADQKCLYCGGSPHERLSDCPRYKQHREKIKKSLRESSKKSYKDILLNSLPNGQGNSYALLSEDAPESGPESDAGEGTSFAPLNPPSRKRKAIYNFNPKVNASNVCKNGGFKKKILEPSPPGKDPSPQEFPPLPSKNQESTFSLKSCQQQQTTTTMGLSKSQNVRSQSEPKSKFEFPLPSDDGKFRISDIFELLLDLLDLSDSWKRIVKMFLPLISSTLKQKASTCPLIAEIISFDE